MLTDRQAVAICRLLHPAYLVDSIEVCEV
jgi:hypothetical protein